MDALALLVEDQVLKGAILVAFDREGGSAQIKYAGDEDLMRGRLQVLTHAFMEALKQQGVTIRF